MERSDTAGFTLGVLQDVVLTLPRSSADLTTEIVIDDPLITPLAVGDVIGRVLLSRAGESVNEVPLQVLEAVNPAGFCATLGQYRAVVSAVLALTPDGSWSTQDYLFLFVPG